MKKRLTIVSLLTVILLLVSAIPAIASTRHSSETPTFASVDLASGGGGGGSMTRVFGIGDFTGDGSCSSVAGDRIGFGVSARTACSYASGRFWLYNATTEDFVYGRFEGASAPIVGEDASLWGHASVNGHGSYYFELFLWEGSSSGKVDFWMDYEGNGYDPPNDAFYFIGGLTSGFIRVRS